MRQTDVRKKTSLNAPTYYGRGHNKVMMTITGALEILSRGDGIF